MRFNMKCGQMETKLVGYLDGKLAAAERRQMEAHLATCAACQQRVAEFRSVWDVLDELPALAPSTAFDNRIRARVRQEPVNAGFWSWIVPSPRMAFAVTALLIASIWLSSFQPGRLAVTHSPSGAAVQNAEAEFGMIKDLPVLEDYDVVTSFDALSELPVQQTSQSQPSNQM
jgi:anti-sigma factor RsiW